MVRHPKILDAIEDLLGPDILCWNTSFFIKEAARSRFRLLASGCDLLGAEFVRRRDRLDRLFAGQQGVGLHEIHRRHASAAGPARRYVRPEQPSDPRSGDRGRGRRGQGRPCRAKTGPGLAASRAAVPRIGAEPLRRPPHRSRRALHPDPSEAGRRPARLGDAGARQGQLRPFRARTCAQARPRARGAGVSQGWCRKNRCACSIAAPARAPIGREGLHSACEERSDEAIQTRRSIASLRSQ